MREPLLERNPEPGPVTLALLVGTASAIEREAVGRYAALARIMRRRDEPEMAEAFERMVAEETRHVAAVERWIASLGETAPSESQFTWRVPADLSKEWSDAAASALLTPYRAFALAVDNEQRAFALYSYLAAGADDPAVAAQAEALALEELRHAALMRRWRREAWHREGRKPRGAPPVITSIADLNALLAKHEAEIAACQHGVAKRLRALGDEESARVVEVVANESSCALRESPLRTAALPPTDNRVRLLLAAQAPLEALSELLETVMRRMDGELFAASEKALANVITRIARLGRQAERLLASASKHEKDPSPNAGPSDARQS